MLLSSFCFSQVSDSLRRALQNAKHDTTRLHVLYAMTQVEENDSSWANYNAQIKSISESNLKTVTLPGQLKKVYIFYLSEAFYNLAYIARGNSENDKAVSYYLESIKFQEENKDTLGVAYSLNNIGAIYDDLGDIAKALEFYDKSLILMEKIRHKDGTATLLNNLALIYNEQGSIAKTIDYMTRSLKMYEELSDKRGISRSLNNLAEVYNVQGDIQKAMEYYEKSLKIKEELRDKNGISTSLNNLGFIYHKQGNSSRAMEYFERGLSIQQELGDKQTISILLNNIGMVYDDEGNIPKALEYYNKSLEIRENINYKKGIAVSLHNIGDIYFRQKNYSGSEAYALRSINISRELGYPENIMNASQLLYKIYKQKNEAKKALDFYEIYISMRDSIRNEETRKASVKSQLKYEYDKKMATDSISYAKETEIKQAQIKKQETDLKAKKNEQYALFGGLGLVLTFAGFMYNRFLLTQKQKQIIESQKKIVEEKQKAIMDSIRYAQRIQKSLITSENYIQRAFSRIKKESSA